MNEIIAMALSFGLGLFIGLFGLFAFWLWHRRQARHYQSIAQERAQLIERVTQMELRCKDYQSQLDHTQQLLDDARQAHQNAALKNTELQTCLAQERKNIQAQADILAQAQNTLTDVFKALSSDALNKNNQAFLDLARTQMEKLNTAAKGDLDNRAKAIETMIAPVQKTLDDLKNSSVGLHERVQLLADSERLLRAETANLVNALRTPSVRGRWGEMQLKRVVELAGMLAHCDFYEQSDAATEEGRLRPDMLIRLPGNKNIIVDAKAPLKAYLESMESALDGQTRVEKLKSHARHIRSHIMALSAKQYWQQFQPCPDFVVLFLPGESFFSAALEQDPELLEMSAERKVILATPTTLLAVLRAVAYGWQQEAVAENAEKISQLGKELHERICGLVSYFSALGRSITKTVENYNQAVGTIEHRVLVTTKRFQTLNLVPENQSPEELAPIEKTIRPFENPES